MRVTLQLYVVKSESAALRKAYEAHCRRTHIAGRDDKAFMDAIVRGVKVSRKRTRRRK